MKTMKAITTFLINKELWVEGESKLVGNYQGAELLKAGLVEEIEGAEQLAPESFESAKKRCRPENREKKPARIQNPEVK